VRLWGQKTYEPIEITEKPKDHTQKLTYYPKSSLGIWYNLMVQGRFSANSQLGSQISISK
jgi:hypothetical protein